MTRTQPPFLHAVSEDTHCASFHRGEFFDTREASGWYVAYRALRLMWVSDGFFAQVCYRARMSLKAKGVPIIPRILHKISMITSQVSIDEYVLMHPGVFIAHGQVVIGGVTEIKSGCFIAPWVSIGLQSGNVMGPTIGHGVFIGSGAKLLGEFTVGDGAVIGAQSMVIRDVPAGVTVAGIPAKQVGNK
ncbi:MAG: serine O-acetyltransferase [Solirubrobacterales bacterium]